MSNSLERYQMFIAAKGDSPTNRERPGHCPACLVAGLVAGPADYPNFDLAMLAEGVVTVPIDQLGSVFGKEW
jgi:hypothetical protein